jgi:hypothetical protein
MTLVDTMEADLRNTFFNTTEFARSALYTPASGVAYAVRGIFDAEYQAVDPDTGSPVISTQPILRVPVYELQTVPGPGDRVTIDAVTYYVKEYRPDGKGVAFLALTKGHT